MTMLAPLRRVFLYPSATFSLHERHYCAAPPLSPTLSPSRNTFGLLARDFSTPPSGVRGTTSGWRELQGIEPRRDRARERTASYSWDGELERNAQGKMCMLRYLAQAVTLPVQSAYQVTFVGYDCYSQRIESSQSHFNKTADCTDLSSLFFFVSFFLCPFSFIDPPYLSNDALCSFNRTSIPLLVPG